MSGRRRPRQRPDLGAPCAQRIEPVPEHRERGVPKLSRPLENVSLDRGPHAFVPPSDVTVVVRRDLRAVGTDLGDRNESYVDLVPTVIPRVSRVDTLLAGGSDRRVPRPHRQLASVARQGDRRKVLARVRREFSGEVFRTKAVRDDGVARAQNTFPPPAQFALQRDHAPKRPFGRGQAQQRVDAGRTSAMLGMGTKTRAGGRRAQRVFEPRQLAIGPVDERAHGRDGVNGADVAPEATRQGGECQVPDHGSYLAARLRQRTQRLHPLGQSVQWLRVVREIQAHAKQRRIRKAH